MGTRMNLDTIGCVWTGELDLNTLRVDRDIFESGKKKKFQIQKYPDRCVAGALVKLTCRLYSDKAWLTLKTPASPTRHSG